MSEIDKQEELSHKKHDFRLGIWRDDGSGGTGLGNASRAILTGLDTACPHIDLSGRFIGQVMKRLKSKHQALASIPETASPRGGEIGERLKRIRQDRELTLADVSKRTGVSTSTLSKIENAQVSPSFDVIMRISEGLGIALEDFVRPGRKAEVHGRKAVTRYNDGVYISSGQYDYRAHATDLVHKHMLPLEMQVRARTAAEFEHWSQHEGEEYVFVLSGEIEVHTECYAPFRLKTGESAYFDSSMRHIYVTVSRNDARVLSISYDPLLARGSVEAR